jgi:hypothetical protein|tara:strand:- start:358 stop:651 length:294 start_codon:yes stop_codon:yes gene_type:complete
MNKLTSQQLESIKEQFVDLIIDGMDCKSLEQYAHEQMLNYFDKLTDSEIKEEVDNYSDDLYDELVDNVQIEDEDAKYQHLEEIREDVLPTREQLEYM